MWEPSRQTQLMGTEDAIMEPLRRHRQIMASIYLLKLCPPGKSLNLVSDLKVDFYLPNTLCCYLTHSEEVK